MLTKLALKNASKSLKDYGIYFFTLFLGVCIFYMFNSIYAQQDIMVVTQTTNQSMRLLTQSLSYISVFVAVVLGFLIVYANNFFIKRRKKELGIYLTLGMTRKNISLILLLETSIMAVIALIVGLVIGVFGSQFMSLFTAKIFEADLSAYKFIFSPSAAVKSVLYFGLIFAIVVIFNIFTIGKFKLIDLLYGGRKNETLKNKSIGLSAVLFVISVICLVSAYVLILKNGLINLNQFFLLSIVLGTVGTLLFFLSISGLLIKMVQSNKKIYYKNLNMFVLRQLNSKINTNFVSVSVVCIILLLVIGIFSSGYSMQNILSKELSSQVPYDFSLVSDDENNEDIYAQLPESLKENWNEYHEITVYNSAKAFHYGDFDLNLSDISYNIHNSPIEFITVSDYNHLMKLQNKDTISLQSNQYAILAIMESYRNLAEQFIEKDIRFDLGTLKITPSNIIFSDKLSNTEFGGITFIVSDDLENALIQNTTSFLKYLNITDVDESAASDIQDELEDYLRDKRGEGAFAYFTSKQELYANSVSTKALVSFLAIYLGIVFMITCAAILAIQQLSEAADNKERYALLTKLGAEKSMINKALFTQILCYFLMPLSLAVVHSAVGLTAANDVIKYFGKVDVGGTLVITAIFVVVIYSAYFSITYMGSKNIIEK